MAGVGATKNVMRSLCHLSVLLLFLVDGVNAGTTRLDDRLAQPFAVNNNSPFIRVFGVPAMTFWDVVATGDDAVAIRLDLTSNFTDAERTSESIRIDGETYRTSLRWTHGLVPGWEAGLEIPVVAHSGGFLDEFIVDWHDFLGLKQLGRDQAENNRLAYRYIRAGQTRFNVDESHHGLGDILLFSGKRVAVQSSRHPDLRLTVRGQLKVPTGEANNLLGSGGWDAAVWAQAANRWGRVWGYGGLGMAYLGPGDVLPELQRHWVAVGNVGIAWQALRRLVLKVQLDTQSSIYRDTELKQLDDPAVQIALGGTVRAGRQWFVDVAVIEDELNFEVSPDVSFYVRVWRKFSARPK